MTIEKSEELICCPQFEPEEWDNRLFEWKDKRFIKAKVSTIFNMPVNFGQVIKRLDDKVIAAKATVQESLCLSDHTSKWNMDIYLAVDKEIPDAENVILSGNYYCKVYEGQLNDTGEWCADYDEILKNKGFKMKKMYMWYTTCPKCAKKYGKNYVAIISEVE